MEKVTDAFSLETDRQTSTAPLRRFRHHAMATTFEIHVVEPDATFAGQAAAEAFAELDRLEQELSRFIETSDISRINRLAAGEAIGVGPAALECLKTARQVTSQTEGAFDVTIGPLLDWWRVNEGVEDPDLDPGFRAARARCGMHRLQIDEAARVIGVAGGVTNDGVCVDLGGIGKGHAVDRMAALLREWGIASSLVHGGHSTAYGMGADWTLALRDPADPQRVLERVSLRDQALSGSGLLIHGRHIIDPRADRPAGGPSDRVAAWAIAPTAALSDALSTAFMVMTREEIESTCHRRDGVTAMRLVTGANRSELERFGFESRG